MKKAAAPSFHLSELDESEEELLEELLCKHPKRTLIVDIAARKDMQRSGKEDSTRQGWRKIGGERERERQREEEGKRERDRERQREEEGEERESVVTGEQRGVSEWFQTSFCP